MASFFVDLWESIFTPGPTPSILKAANISFASLQLVLLVLLVATRSVHFVILSVLCAGLWWSINWFATELKAAQMREEQDKNAATAAKKGGSDGDNDESDTEVEADGQVVGSSSRTGGKNDVEPIQERGELRHRGAEDASLGGGTQSSVSTEDEWEKVSENEQEKDKKK